jgi:hypothetical protein
MSGASALAAARKRRANPQPTQNQNQNQNQNPIQNQNLSSIQEEPPKMGNPALLLMQHQVIVQRLQKDISELKTTIADLKVSKEKEEKDNYKSEYLGLLEEMKEMKKVLLKVQSFSMETNLEVMKLKREQQMEKDRVDLSVKDVSSVNVTMEVTE